MGFDPLLYIYVAIHALDSINAIGPAPLRGGLSEADSQRRTLRGGL
jgi:hypothetical protein